MKTLFIQLFFLFFIFSSTVFSQPNINWQNCYGGSGYEVAHKMIKTTDNGYLFVGSTSSIDGDVSGIHYYYDPSDSTWYPSQDVWVLKTDSNGVIEWQKCLGGSGFESGIAPVETDNGYVILCAANSSNDGDITNNHGGVDYWLVKLDYSGTLIWQNSFGSYDDEMPYSIANTTDGNFILAGHEYSIDSGMISGHHGANYADLWITKINSMGNLIWQKCLGGSSNEFFGSVKVDSFGNIYLVGLASSIDGDVTCHTGTPFHGLTWLLKLDSVGNILWQQCYGGTSDDEIFSLELNGSKILMAGFSNSTNYDLTQNFGYRDAWILLADTSGNIVFSQNYGGSRPDEFWDAKFTNDGKIIAGGLTNSNDVQVNGNHSTASDVWLISVDTLGSLLWQKCFGGTAPDQLTSILCSNNGSIQFSAWSQSINNGDAIGCNTNASFTLGDFLLIELNSIVGIDELNSKSELYLFPNPCNGIFNISLRNQPNQFDIILFNALGEIELEKAGISGSLITLDISDRPKGIYFVKTMDGDHVAMKKLIHM